MDIVWLSSYPKSGNTWVRFLFTNLIFGPFDNSQTIFDVTPVLERGVEPHMLHADRLNLIKTHKMFAPELPFMEHARRIVYIARDPFDVMLSNLNYFFLTSGAAAGKDAGTVQRLAEGYVQQFLSHGGDPNWLQHRYGTWVQHAESWVHNDAGLPVAVVRYEDLKRDTAGQLRQVCDFIGFEASDAAVAQAVERSSFEAMRAMEEREIRDRIPGMFYVPARDEKRGDIGFRFMNRGQAGVAKEAVGNELRQRFVARFQPMIGEFGYA